MGTAEPIAAPILRAVSSRQRAPALAFALALVPAGRLGDSVGRRRMFLLGLLSLVLTVR